ncbi:bifunctional DNA-formamidopyrimidine glycosylase/DNA-(apurinic or apyrimidinic site) lyase [Brevibacillus sp. B_LB10_24]|uniref:bifunctional DNA-formamidopyrimidine glycosylase/DNA-(apurinic or apyrimidinic site) lyase n=1 Tax=Brevibacillus sp. B_LB10_24 TaxID=3380645 RepID=UPI0038BD76B8
MPELPEMENYRKLLSQQLAGRTITNAAIHRVKSINTSVEQFREEVIGSRLAQINRRAKYLLFSLDSGKVLLLHLMLGGWMYCGTDRDKPERTTQVELSFGEKTLYFIGLRLGYLHLLTPQEAVAALAGLGPEPLDEDFTEAIFIDRFRGKGGRLKTALIDQKQIAGIGNCYSDEICFAAGIKPTRSCRELTEGEWSKLYRSTRRVLTEAIARGGYMESPLYAGDTLTGGFDELCKVYDRSGEPCYRCGGPIVRTVISGRKTFYCERCQS